MSLKDWETQVLAEPGAHERVAAIEDELRLAAGLTALREEAGLSQRELAKRIGVSQPRIAAIERSRNVTLDVLESYVRAVGGDLQITVRIGTTTRSLAAPVKTPTTTGAAAKRATPRASQAAAGAAPRAAAVAATKPRARARAAAPTA